MVKRQGIQTSSPPEARPAFYFDLGSPLAYLAAEFVLHALPQPAEWRPVLASELPGSESFRRTRSSTST